MKGLLSWTIFAAFYMLIVFLYQVTAQSQSPFNLNFLSPSAANPGVGQNSNNNASQGMFASWPSTLNLDEWGISDPGVQQTINSMYGTVVGRPDCVKRSICVFGNYLRELPGRDLIFMVVSQYIPRDWSLLYDVFRISVMYGQDCQAYTCGVPANLPNAQPGVSPVTPPAPVVPGVAPLPTAVPEEVDNAIHKGSAPNQQKQFI